MGSDLLKNIELQINEAKTVEELRSILLRNPTLRAKIDPLCIQRKNEIEGVVTDPVVNP
jgi:hypothetical protein